MSKRKRFILVAAFTLTNRDGNQFGKLGKNPALFDVGDAFLVLDLTPFRMPAHKLIKTLEH